MHSVPLRESPKTAKGFHDFAGLLVLRQYTTSSEAKKHRDRTVLAAPNSMPRADKRLFSGLVPNKMSKWVPVLFLEPPQIVVFLLISL